MTVTVFGYLILISIEFYLDSTSKFVKNTPLRVAFSALFSVFGNVVKHGLSCLIYYISRHCFGGPTELYIFLLFFFVLSSPAILNIQQCILDQLLLHAVGYSLLLFGLIHHQLAY